MTMSRDRAHAPDSPTAFKTHVPAIPIALLVATGYVLTLVALFPGYLTTDASFVYAFMQEWMFGDWQSPMMSLLWWVIDPIAPGSGSMFVLVATLYWLGFLLVAFAVARRSAWIGLAVPILAMTPSAVMMLVMIWRDMLFAVVWLLATAMVYAGTTKSMLLQRLTQIVALCLIVFGVLLRPTAFIAAPILAAYAIWPARFEFKRTALLYLPGMLIGYAAIHLVYYVGLNVNREHPLHSLLVFDLGGITHFAGTNQFPVAWNESQNALLTSTCYNRERWDAYWTIEPCSFVMRRLEGQDAESKGEVIFGTSRLSNAWLAAVTAHPLAYLQHRSSHFWQMISGANLTFELYRLHEPAQARLAQHRPFMIVLTWHDVLKSTILFRVGFWLALATLVGLMAWPLRDTGSGAFAVSMAGSAVIYVGTFFVVGVAGDFRYGYWCVLASLTGAAALAAAVADKRAG
jgi:hypothetical protein